MPLGAAGPAFIGVIVGVGVVGVCSVGGPTGAVELPVVFASDPQPMASNNVQAVASADGE